MKGIQVLDRPASQSFYAVAGRLLLVQSLDPQLSTSIERLFAGWQLVPVPFPERNPDIKITFSSGASWPQIPPGLSQFEVAEGGRCYRADDGYYLRFADSWLRLEESKPVIVSAFIATTSAAERARVTSFAVCAALRRFGIFEMHSAGVVLPNTSHGVLLVGPSGSGKSTLTSQLASAGWGYLSDDEMLLTWNGIEVEARGFRSFFALASPEPKNGLKTCFEPARVFNAPRADRVAPGFLLFTSISGANQTHGRELTQAETMSRLIRACPWATYDTTIAGRNLELLSRLARQAKGFTLLAGTDLLDPGQASRIIGSVCGS